jgi:hypothetical protein
MHPSVVNNRPAQDYDTSLSRRSTDQEDARTSRIQERHATTAGAVILNEIAPEAHLFQYAGRRRLELDGGAVSDIATMPV